MATEVVFPMLGVTVDKGKIVEWLKSEGDSVTKGESIFVVEADKVTTEVESPATGILSRILLQADQEVPVLTVVAVITEPGEEVPDQYLQKIRKATMETSDGPMALLSSKAGKSPVPEAQFNDEPLKVIPAARKKAQEQGIDLNAIKPTGPGAVITFHDVETAAAAICTSTHLASPKVSTLARRQAETSGISLDGIQGSGVRGRIMRDDLATAAPAVAQPLEGLGRVIKMDTMRRTIARRLTDSAFSTPHVAFYTDVHMDPLLAYRKQVTADFEKKFGLKPSVNDFLIKAVAMNIVDFPMLNATLKEEDEIHILPQVNVGLAVAIPNGLIVPAIAGAERAGLAEIARQRADLVERAQKNKLIMEEMERGTFTISSLAQYDVCFFTSILNPPQSGILSVAKTREELALEDGEVVAKHVSSMGLAVDHRIIDGALAADFLQNLKWKLEKPAFTFMWS